VIVDGDDDYDGDSFTRLLTQLLTVVLWIMMTCCRINTIAVISDSLRWVALAQE
jgi:hypothetical protein